MNSRAQHSYSPKITSIAIGGIRSLIAMLVLLLSGCALSPQHIPLVPAVNLDIQPYGEGRRVSVEVRDERSNLHLGSRGGVYKDTSHIHLAPDALETLDQSVSSILKQLDFQPINEKEQYTGLQLGGSQQNDSDVVRFVIAIDSISYHSDDAFYANEYDSMVVLRLSVIDGDRFFESRFKTQASDMFLWAPSRETNMVTLNRVVGTTLTRMFEDPKLEAFLNYSEEP